MTMDKEVRCPNCGGNRYAEVDGASVKCLYCGTVFNIKDEKPEPPEPPAQPAAGGQSAPDYTPAARRPAQDYDYYYDQDDEDNSERKKLIVKLVLIAIFLLIIITNWKSMVAGLITTLLF